MVPAKVIVKSAAAEVVAGSYGAALPQPVEDEVAKSLDDRTGKPSTLTPPIHTAMSAATAIQRATMDRTRLI